MTRAGRWGCRATVYRLQGNDPRFLKHCRLAIEMAGVEAELTAWERGVTGVEEQVVCGGKVITLVKYSDAMLRLLLQGSNPKKYGPNPGFSRKRLLKHERKQMEKEIRAEIAAKRMTFDESIKPLDKRLQAFGLRHDKKQLAAGWIQTEEGHWIPPGWVRIGDAAAGSADGGDDPDEGRTPRVSV